MSTVQVTQKRPYRKRNYKKKNKGYQLATKNYVKRVLKTDTEMKFKDDYQSINVSTLYGIQNIFQPTNGTGHNEYVGDEVKVQKILFRYELINADTYNWCRLIIFQWKPITPPTNLSLITSPPGTSGAADYLGMYNYDNRTLYNIIFDKMLYTDADSPTSVGGFKIFTPKKDKFSSLINLNPAYGNHRLYCYFVTDSNLSGHPTLKINYRVFFTDS